MKREPFIDARAAARFIGYAPGVDDQGRPLPAEHDPQMKCFYKWAEDRPHLKHRRGRRLVFRESELEAEIAASTDADLARRNDRLAHMRELARRAARGEDISRLM